MKIVLQRVLSASVSVLEKEVGRIEKGLLVFVGFENFDTKEKIDLMIKKIINLRIFSDENDKINFSVKDIFGEILCVSQFTLLADTKKGNRPSFLNAGDSKLSKELFDYFVRKIRNQSGLKVEQGVFGANMKISLTNDGPFTIIL